MDAYIAERFLVCAQDFSLSRSKRYIHAFVVFAVNQRQKKKVTTANRQQLHLCKKIRPCSYNDETELLELQILNTFCNGND